MTLFERDLAQQNKRFNMQAAPVPTMLAGNPRVEFTQMSASPSSPPVATVQHTAVDDEDALARENSRLVDQLEDAENLLLGRRLSDEQLTKHFSVTPKLLDRFTCARAFIAHVRHLPEPLARPGV